MNKNIGPFLAFNEKWFDKNQKVLLWLLNSKLTKRWFRWILRIRKHDVGYDKIITSLLPNSYTVFEKFIGEQVLLTTDFRTHPKYGKRIYYAFKPLWWCIHAWDEVFADRYMPQWSYGFDTLTAYPDANPETTTVDGRFYTYTLSTWQLTHDASASDGADDNLASAQSLYAKDNDTGPSRQINRAMYLFDTSALPDGASVSAATLSIYEIAAGNQSDALGQDIHICSSTPASNTALTTADFDQFGSTSFGSKDQGTWADDAYNEISLNATGLAAISKTGITKFGMRYSSDINNSRPGPSTNYSYITNYFADQTGTTNDPKLVVTYSTVVGPTNLKTLNGLASASMKTIDGLGMASVKTWNGLT